MAKFGLRLSVPEADLIVRALDADGDGGVSVSEFLNYMRRYRPGQFTRPALSPAARRTAAWCVVETALLAALHPWTPTPAAATLIVHPCSRLWVTQAGTRAGVRLDPDRRALRGRLAWGDRVVEQWRRPG